MRDSPPDKNSFILTSGNKRNSFSKGTLTIKILVPNQSDFFFFNDPKLVKQRRGAYGSPYIYKGLGNREAGLTKAPYIKISSASSSRF